ncbi:MAG TPA: hypothetical protein VF434_03370, partial [Promineifilum sp.]
PPYKLDVFDVVMIRVLGVFEELGQPIAEAYSIQPDGTVDLGPTYGKVKVVNNSSSKLFGSGRGVAGRRRERES